jgi:DNA mismatch repair ATPase MutS
VKSIAQRVAEGRNLFVIFDELFKGTNVKDAYDATLAVTDAYASHRNCLYIISTHIVEVGPALSEKCGNVQFRFLPTQMDGTRLIYPYKLAEGISADRHGMTIIKNEKILDIIRGEEINESEI